MASVREIEERLFILLDMTEKQASQNEEIQNALIKVIKQNYKLTQRLEERLEQLNTSQQQFNNIVYKGVIKGTENVIANDIKTITKTTISDGISESISELKHQLDEVSHNLNDQNNDILIKAKKLSDINNEQIREIQEQYHGLDRNYTIKNTAFFIGVLLVVGLAMFSFLYLYHKSH